MNGKLSVKAALAPLRTLYNIGTISDLTDGQLLERFATDAGEVAELALAALIERHEVMVWRVCLSILRDEHDAEDAFQATFFVLIRKARSLWVRGSLGPWLHQVACRTASCLRRTIDRRRVHERCCAKNNAASSVDFGTSRDAEVDATIHDEVNRLPEKYRTPIVLCDLEGRTHQEAARFLGWPIGTVKSRQSHGRGLLRDRLVRRGIGLAVAGSVAELVRQTSLAGTPRELSRRTAAGAMQQSAYLLTGVDVSSRALALTQGVVRAMLWIRIRFLCVAVLAAGVVCFSASVYVRGFQGPAARDEQTVLKGQSTTEAAKRTPRLRRKRPGSPRTLRTRSRCASRSSSHAGRKSLMRWPDPLANLPRSRSKNTKTSPIPVTSPLSRTKSRGALGAFTIEESGNESRAAIQEPPGVPGPEDLEGFGFEESAVQPRASCRATRRSCWWITPG